MLNEDSWICKDNRLVNASYKLNVGELKLILAISSMVNPFDEKFKDYIISIKDFAKLLGVNLSTNKNFYSRVKKASGILLSKRVTIHEKEGDFQTVWLSGIQYYDREGKVAVSFHPKLIKYYLQLQKYTKYRLKNITNLNSEYSLKLYEALKQYEKIGERIYDLDELKKFLGVEHEYDRFYDLKRRILLVTQNEISEKTDISFEFKEIKEGRSIKKIKFNIKTNKSELAKESDFLLADEEISATRIESSPEKISENMAFEVRNVKLIMHEHTISDREALAIFKSSDGDFKMIKKVYNDGKNRDIPKFIGWMISLVKPGAYIEPKINYSKDTFNNYEQRPYDGSNGEMTLDEMERELLGFGERV